MHLLRTELEDKLLLGLVVLSPTWGRTQNYTKPVWHGLLWPPL